MCKILPNILRICLLTLSDTDTIQVVDFLLRARANPNAADRWNGTPLQDALQNNHQLAANLLRTKNATVPQAFGGDAVCTAAAEGDIPTLRILHEFGLSMTVGDYDARFPLHLAASEGRVLAVSFLLGISADPNTLDRWHGSPMDDALQGGTLYHIYCAKLLQGWGGELNRYEGTEEGNTFLEELQKVSIKSVRLLISKLIAQGIKLQYIHIRACRHRPTAKMYFKNEEIFDFWMCVQIHRS
jgi:ankyrin repeat protein